MDREWEILSRGDGFQKRSARETGAGRSVATRSRAMCALRFNEEPSLWSNPTAAMTSLLPRKSRSNHRKLSPWTDRDKYFGRLCGLYWRETGGAGRLKRRAISW